MEEEELERGFREIYVGWMRKERRESEQRRRKCDGGEIDLGEEERASAGNVRKNSESEQGWREGVDLMVR
jgi:hypothetical protein